MAFDEKYLGSKGSHGFGNAELTYHTTDTPATVAAADYFNAVADRLKVGDTIEVWQVNSLANLGQNSLSITAHVKYDVETNNGTAVTIGAVWTKS